MATLKKTMEMSMSLVPTDESKEIMKNYEDLWILLLQ